MKTDSPFEYLTEPKDLVSIRFAGETYQVPEGANLAAALLAAGVKHLRDTPVSGEPRAPFCMMGACFDCLVLIEGVTRQACMLEVRDGLVVDRVKAVKGECNG